MAACGEPAFESRSAISLGVGLVGSCRDCDVAEDAVDMVESMDAVLGLSRGSTPPPGRSAVPPGVVDDCDGDPALALVGRIGAETFRSLG